jgi:hypothetical protein
VQELIWGLKDQQAWGKFFVRTRKEQPALLQQELGLGSSMQGPCTNPSCRTSSRQKRLRSQQLKERAALVWRLGESRELGASKVSIGVLTKIDGQYAFRFLLTTDTTLGEWTLGRI